MSEIESLIRRVERLEQDVKALSNVRNRETQKDIRIGAAVRLLLSKGATAFIIRKDEAS